MKPRILPTTRNRAWTDKVSHKIDVFLDVLMLGNGRTVEGFLLFWAFGA